MRRKAMELDILAARSKKMNWSVIPEMRNCLFF
jgi:hypothetical protein